jgi:hypothetical protein
MMMRILICLAALVLAGCAPPRILGSNENGVIVAMGGRSEQEAVAVAEQHCRRFGRVARPAAASAGSAGASPAILFDCVSP